MKCCSQPIVRENSCDLNTFGFGGGPTMIHVYHAKKPVCECHHNKKVANEKRECRLKIMVDEWDELTSMPHLLP